MHRLSCVAATFGLDPKMGAIGSGGYSPGGRVLAVRPVELDDDPDEELDPEELDPLEPLDDDPPEEADALCDPDDPLERASPPDRLDELVDRVYPCPFTATPRGRSSPRTITTGRV